MTCCALRTGTNLAIRGIAGLKKWLKKFAPWIVAAIFAIQPLASATATLINLATQVKGTLSVSNGGIGSTSAGSSGQVLISDGTKFAPGDPLIGGLGASGATVSYTNCDSSAVYDASTSGATQLVALSGSTVIYVCGFSFAQSTTSAVHVALEYGTGSNCATSPTKITPSYSLQAGASTGPAGIVIGPSISSGLKTTSGKELCIVTDAAVSVQGLVWYTQR